MPVAFFELKVLRSAFSPSPRGYNRPCHGQWPLGAIKWIGQWQSDLRNPAAFTLHIIVGLAARIRSDHFYISDPDPSVADAGWQQQHITGLQPYERTLRSAKA